MEKIVLISGGQTGVDRAALDVALELGLPCGGWCPEGRLAEDGPIPERYPVRELPGADYPVRTLANVLQSDGTLLIYFEQFSGGTRLTLDLCLRFDKPFLLVDGEMVSEARAALVVRRFLKREGIEKLNVAGPRASKEPRAYPYTYRLLKTILTPSIDGRQRGG